MIQVWVYDDNKQFVTTLEVEEILENMTTTPLEVEFYKSIFDEDNQIWYEGATAEEIEEIKRQEEANKPPVEPNEMEVLKEEVIALEKENKLLKAQVEALSQTSDFHEELIVEMANKVYA